MGRTRAPLEQALQLGVIDAIATDWASALDGADLVLLGMPVGQMAAVMSFPGAASAAAYHRHRWRQHQVRRGRGGTRGAFGDKVRQFVPGHPIAGAEKSGVVAAQADLYVDKRVVLTPLPENSADDVKAVRMAWELCGAKVSQLAADEHDRVFAAVSHLPHLLAFALVHDFAQRPNSDQLFGFAAGGFRDFTRIASSHPEMWRDICVANRHALLAELDAYMIELMRTRVMLAGADADGLEAMFSTARERRDAWLDSLLPPGE
jgi:prephenate dehydrogenase